MKSEPISDSIDRGRRTLTGIFIGPPRDVKDPSILHSMSLVAFLAWVGLGSDGLSSSCYGPEEAFLALGQHQYLAVFLAMLMALTVFIMFPKSKWIGCLALLYALYVGVGVSMTIHWFSDFLAGAIIGSVVGVVVGNGFLEISRRPES